MNIGLKVTKDTMGVWVVEDTYGRHTRIGPEDNDRYVAEGVRDSMEIIYRKGRMDAFAELRELIGVKNY